MTTTNTGDYLPGFVLPQLPPQPAHPLAGQTIVITGQIPGFKRPEAKLLIKQYGGSVTDTVLPGCYLFWDGYERSKKLEQAKQKGIAIMPSSLLADILRHPNTAAPLPAATDPEVLRLAQQAPGAASPPPPPQGRIDEFLNGKLS